MILSFTMFQSYGMLLSDRLFQSFFLLLTSYLFQSVGLILSNVLFQSSLMLLSTLLFQSLVLLLSSISFRSAQLLPTFSLAYKPTTSKLGISISCACPKIASAYGFGGSCPFSSLYHTSNKWLKNILTAYLLALACMCAGGNIPCE